MKSWFARRPAPPRLPLDDELPDRTVRPLTATDRACCCPARPVVTVIVPPGPDRRHPADLLLCRHHYRASGIALLAAGAAVYDADGLPVTSRACSQYAARPEPASSAPQR